MRGPSVGVAASRWRAWWEKNRGKSRPIWKAESIARARRKIADTPGEAATEAAIALAGHEGTKREGIAALKRIVLHGPCKDDCWTARSYLHRIEPRARWVPPASSP